VPVSSFPPVEMCLNPQGLFCVLVRQDRELTFQPCQDHLAPSHTLVEEATESEVLTRSSFHYLQLKRG